MAFISTHKFYFYSDSLPMPWEKWGAAVGRFAAAQLNHDTWWVETDLTGQRKK